MYYLRARYYDPEIMRFVAEDGYEGNTVDPLSLNLYIYCRNNPIIYIDASGHNAGDLFNSRDAAAIDFAKIYATEAEGVKNNWKWIAYIYKTSEGKYSYTTPVH